MSQQRSTEYMLAREAAANRPKHWVRCVTACNSRCIFCLDSDTPRNVYLPAESVKADILRGRQELGAERVILSGGEASLHPEFPEFIRYALEVGYDRVQTVTNGFRYAEREFFDRCMEAGLGEITFSLHGHTEALHDRLTRHPGSFRNLIKGLIRALRTPGLIVSVDVVINKQNVAVLDRIVELCLKLGVREFDLLHVIPQAAAFDHRDELFYDVRDHLEVLHRVFRLTRHPGVTVWTNRFPVSYLEGLEDLIQDPHKMLDEVNGRRYHVRRYLDTGEPLDCRQAERCQHCFIEPFCTTADRVVAAQNARAFRVYWLGEGTLDGEPLPFGCDRVGVRARDLEGALAAERPAGAGLYAEVEEPGPLRAVPEGLALTLVAEGAAHLETWLSAPLPKGVDVEVRLNRDTATWLVDNRDRVERCIDALHVHQPSHEHMKDAVDHDVRDPRSFFRTLDLPLRVSGLPACLAPGATLVDAPAKLERGLFDRETGRLAVRALARHHVAEHYRAKSVRCRDCRVNDRCDGAHINMIRDQGLGQLRPLGPGPEGDAAVAQLEARFATPPPRVGDGRAPEPAAASLPGFPMPEGAELDPLAVIATEQLVRKQKREELRARAGQERS